MDAYRLSGENYNDSNLIRIQEYLANGLDPNFHLYRGVTVFIKAVSCLSDNINVIRELISAGADVNSRTQTKATPLILAVHNRKTSVVKELIQSGASVNAKDFLGRTALHHAVRKCATHIPPLQSWRREPDIEIIDELLKHEGIDCNQVDFRGETPLMFTVKDRQFTITRQLLKHFVNPDVGNNFSQTPLHVAFSRPQNDVEIHLLLGGANIYSLDQRGRTPLDVLIENGLDVRDNLMLNAISKLVAFKYSITSELKRKLMRVPRLSQVFNQCCKEADRMRLDFIYCNITMHDFLYGCFVEKDSEILLHQIHKPVVERLGRDIYPEYCIEFANKIPTSSLTKILQLFAEENCRVRDLAYLLSQPNINAAITKHLRHDEVFELIRAFFVVAISE